MITFVLNVMLKFIHYCNLKVFYFKYNKVPNDKLSSFLNCLNQLSDNRFIVNPTRLFTLQVNDKLYLNILDDFMKKKNKGKKTKKKLSIDNAPFKSRYSFFRKCFSQFKSFPTSSQLQKTTMNLKDGPCSSTALSQNFERSSCSLITPQYPNTADDVIILDSSDGEELEIVYDSNATKADQVLYYLKNNQQSPSPQDFRAVNIEEAAKQGKEALQKIRFEKYTRFGENFSRKENRSNGFKFRVLSWNILSQQLLEQHHYLYGNSHKVALNWDFRKNLILEEIGESNADIICLQEVEENNIHDLRELRNLGYDSIFKKRTNDKIDGCAIYYKKDVLVLKEYSFIEFYQPNVRLLDRDNVGIVAKFSPKTNEKVEFVVATTHLLYNPKRHDIKLVQMQLLLAEIERISFNGAIRQNDDELIPTYHPCILTGDLNLLPHSGVYQLITEGHLRYENLSPRNLSNSEYSHYPFSSLPRALLPPYLGITDNCQHEKVISHRQLVRQPADEENRLIQLYNSERKRHEMEMNWREMHLRIPENKTQNSSETHSESMYGTGVLSHNLKFKSVYQHEQEGEFEATTHQDKWSTVDYIFYSPVSEDAGETLLHLISYKNLPTIEECQNNINALPNLFCGSDHLPLISTFFLKDS